MRMVLLSEVFAPNMGYLENILPKYLGRAGLDVHVVTMGLPPYYMHRYSNTYDGFAGEAALRPGMIQHHDGFTLHVVGRRRALGYMQPVGLLEKLRALRPQIVQTTAVLGWLPLQAAFGKSVIGYKLFTGSHYHASVFPLASREHSFYSKDLLGCRLTRTLPGWLTSLAAEKCYAIAEDCADVAVRFFGVPRHQIDICPLGVDTELFSQIVDHKGHENRKRLRRDLGFDECEIVCVYSGRFTADKDPLLLASAIDRLSKHGWPFRGLFIGDGEQAREIQSCQGCQIHPFVPVQELPDFFRASDIGVWPTQESTSMLDAAACGLPLIANHTITALERLEGNGLCYRLGDVDDMVRALMELRDSNTRKCMGLRGATKMAREFSWDSIARRRVRDYCSALGVATIVPESMSDELLARVD